MRGLSPLWFQGSVNRQIFGAAATIAVVSLAAKVLTLGKDTAVAYSFGTSDGLEAFLIALVLPTFAINVVASSLNTAFISVLVEHRERQGGKSAFELCESILAISLAVLGLTTLLLMLAAPWAMPYLAPGFAADKLEEVHRLFILLLPVVLLSGMASVYTGLLNAGERFALGALAPAAVPFLTLLVVLLFGGRIGIEALSYGTVAGYFLHATVVARAVAAAGLPVVPRWRGWTPPLRRIAAQYGPLVAGGSLMSSTTIVDQAMASLMPQGSVAALSYGSRAVTIVTSLATVALGTAVLPHFSRMAARGEWAALRRSLRTWSTAVVALSVAVTVALFVASPLIVRGVFQRGAFTADDAASVTLIQTMYLLQVPFYVLGILFVRTLTSIQQNRVLLWGNLISFPLNVVLNLTLMRALGTAGIALSTSLVYAVSCVYLGLMLYRGLARIERTEPPKLAPVWVPARAR
jgi:putative peptidoglycan lipid II flippase